MMKIFIGAIAMLCFVLAICVAGGIVGYAIGFFVPIGGDLAFHVAVGVLFFCAVTVALLICYVAGDMLLDG